MSFAVQIIKQLTGKAKDKQIAIQELNRWMKDTSSEIVDNHGWQTLVGGFSNYISVELAATVDKMTVGSKATAQITILAQTFRDLILTGVSANVVLNDDLLDSILVLLEDYPDVKPITKCLAKCLHHLMTKRNFREAIKLEYFEKTLTYCIEFFMAETSRNETATIDRIDRRSECLDLSICFSLLVSCCHESEVLNNAQTILSFINKYLLLYTIENQSFELFLGASLHLLICMDVNQLDVSYTFLRGMLWKLLELFKSKNETIRHYAINLIRIYISIGTQRSEEETSRNSFLYTNTRIIKELMIMLQGHQTLHVSLDQLILLDDNTHPTAKSVLSDSTCYIVSFIHLCSDVFRLSLQTQMEEMQEDAAADIQSSISHSGSSDENPKKRIKLGRMTRLGELLISHKEQEQLAGLQILGLMALRHPRLIASIASEYGESILPYLKSHVPSLSHNACWTVAKMVRMSDELLDFLEPVGVWNAAFLLVVERENFGTAPFGLLDALVARNLVATTKLIELMQVFRSINGALIGPSSLSCLSSLFKYENLWDRVTITSLFEHFLNLLYDFVALRKIMECSIVIKFFAVLIKKSDHESDLPNGLLDYPPVQQDSILFNFMFAKMEARLMMASGFKGLDIAKQLVAAQKPKSFYYNQVRMEILFALLESFLKRSLQATALSTEPERDLIMLLSITRIMQEFNFESLIALHKKTLALLTSLGNSAIEHAASLSKEELRNILANFASPVKHILHPLSLSTSEKLYRAWDSSGISESSIPKDVRLSTAILPLFELSLMGGPISLKNSLNFETDLKISLQFSSNDPICCSSDCHNLIQNSLDTKRLCVYKQVALFTKWKFAKNILACFTKLLKVEHNLIMQISCVRYVASLFASNITMVKNCMEVRKSLSVIVKYFLSDLKYRPLPMRISIAILLTDIVKLDIPEFFNFIGPPLNYCWKLLEVDNFEFKEYCCKVFIPQIIPNIDSLLAFQEIQNRIPTQNNSDVQSISASMIYGCLIIKCPSLRPQSFQALCQIASDQPSLDTTENIFEVASAFFDFPEPIDFAERFLYSVLEIWGDNYEEFPFFLYGLETVEQFFERYVDEIALQAFKLGKFDAILTLQQRLPIDTLKSRIFAKLYSYRLLESDNAKLKEVNTVLIKMDLFFTSFFGDAMPDMILKNTTNIAANILLSISHLSEDPGLTSFIKTGMHQIGTNSSTSNIFTGSDIQPQPTTCNATRSIHALGLLFNTTPDQFFTIAPYRLQALLQKFHVLLYRKGFNEEVEKILLNGYQVLLILIGKSLSHPLLYQLSVLFLSRYSLNCVVFPTAVSMINFASKICFQNGQESNINEQSHRLITALDNGRRSNENGSDLATGKITTCLEFVIACIKKHSETIRDGGICLRMAFASLDPSVKLYESLYVRFKVSRQDLDGISEYIKKYDNRLMHSKVPYERLAEMFDNQEIVGSKSTILSLAQSLYQILGNQSSKLENSDLKLVQCYAKLLAITPFSSLVPVDNEFVKFSAHDKYSCYYGFVYTLDRLFPYLGSPDVKVVTICLKAFGILCSLEEGVEAIKAIGPLKESYLKVFQNRKVTISSVGEKVTFDSFLLESDGKSEASWLYSIARGLLFGLDFPPFFLYLEPMFAVSPDFTALMLPVLFHFKLLCEYQNSKTTSPLISLTLRNFFEGVTLKNRIALSHLLNVIKFLLMVDTAYSFFGSWRELNFYSLAEAALLVEDATFAVYLLELAHARNRNTKFSSSSWQCLLQSYKLLHDFDGFHGIVASLDTENVQLYTLIEQKNYHDHDWLSIWSMEDSILQANDERMTSPLLLQALAKSGHYHSLDKMLENDMNDHGQGIAHVHKEHYESLWRLGKWSIHEAVDSFPVLESKEDVEFDRHIYNCLDRFENSTCLKSLSEMANNHMLYFGKTSRLEVVLPYIELQESIFLISNPDKTQGLFESWRKRSETMEKICPFMDLERILAVRTRIFTSMFMLSKETPIGFPDLSSPFYCHLLYVAKLATANNNIELARTTVVKLKKMFPTVCKLDLLKIETLAQEIEWTRGEQVIAMKFYKMLIERDEADEDLIFKAEMLHTYGMWQISSRSSTPFKIIEEYLKPAAFLIESNPSVLKNGDLFFDLARYSDTILQERNNDDMQNRSVQLLAQREEELFRFQSQGASSTKKDYFVRKQKKQIELDKEAIATVEEERTSFLLLSVENYLKNLVHSQSKSEHSVFRLISLWFSNYTNSAVNALIHEYLNLIRSQVYLVLMYQLAARLTSQEPDLSSSFYVSISSLVESIVIDYPYHTIGYLIALKNVATKETGSSRSGIAHNASAFLRKLFKVKDLKPIVISMDSLFSAYVIVANQAISKRSSKDKSKPGHVLDPKSDLLKFSADDKMPVLTYEQPIGREKEYTNIVYLTRIENTYTLPGGINAPKVLKCHGSDGKVYKQLVKSKDDLRQDSVLSSVFGMINKLLMKKKTNLNIRTYRIVPLAPQAGVLHWVDGTIPLGELLIEAQPKNLGDWSLSKCRQKMKEVQEKIGANVESKLSLFKEIQSNLPCVLGSVFFHYYRDPIAWYRNRDNFTRSVAASSMGGYMLGVGDRHSQNLLFDKATGEIIHIDLGIAFDQGKLLSTPETVPFRLTRNMVDGMGITQCEGVFKRGCEQTLKVLRDEKDILFTLLDVFRHDPLYSWAISPLKLRKVQTDKTEVEDDGESCMKEVKPGNAEADIALFGVHKKLSSTLSVECQVQELINTALDERNLCVMYHGWQSYL